MPHQILLYISAGSDLAAEREVMGRAITEIPLDISWRIYQSPGSGRLVDREAVELADIHLFMLGSDIRAPVGYEWAIARQAERWPIPLLKTSVKRTPAALDFMRFVGLQSRWFHFYRPADLRRRMLRLLSAFILFRSSELELSLVEIETLLAWRKTISTVPVDEETVGGAGEGGLLISRKRLIPLDGTPIIKEVGSRDGEKTEQFWPDIDLDWLEMDEQADLSGHDLDHDNDGSFKPGASLN
ncbi:MAG: hypothetical protein JXA42_01285 [Anaerolineales bacterium]|nr:hypothetical protein [Anaerolineales bacterium]